jgi:hypothetical protein
VGEDCARQREARQGMVGLGKGWGGPLGEGLSAFFLGARDPRDYGCSASVSTSRRITSEKLSPDLRIAARRSRAADFDPD